MSSDRALEAETAGRSISQHREPSSDSAGANSQDLSEGALVKLKSAVGRNTFATHSLEVTNDFTGEVDSRDLLLVVEVDRAHPRKRPVFVASSSGAVGWLLGSAEVEVLVGGG